jgi:hypothetical protein
MRLTPFNVIYILIAQFKAKKVNPFRQDHTLRYKIDPGHEFKVNMFFLM